MVKKGKLWICDRCGRTEFAELMEIYGNEFICRKPSDGWTNGAAFYDDKTLCPHCAAVYRTRLEEMKRRFYKNGEDDTE